MREKFQRQLTIGQTPIMDLNVNLKSRHQLTPVLIALQHIFVNPLLSEAVFKLLSEKIYPINNNTGRPGMHLWEILVLGVVRLSLSIDYDDLLDKANNHMLIRELIGHSVNDFKNMKLYKYQTLVDNIHLLDEDLLEKINILIVKEGHEKIKKKEEENEGEFKSNIELNLKVDSFPVETNVHFPTDINLTYDCARKCLDTINSLKNILGNSIMVGWRELNSTRKSLKSHYRRTSEIHRKKGNNYEDRLKDGTKKYLKFCRKLENKVNHTIELKVNHTIASSVLIGILKEYRVLLTKHIDLVRRRILLGEKIPHNEKIFSIFEQHTEWLYKGKLYNGVKLGKNVTIATDQYHFILHYNVMENEVDKELTIKIVDSISDNFDTENYCFKSISFDKNYYSKLSKDYLEVRIENVILPKPGKKSSAQEDLEKSKDFIYHRKKHSTVEANINQLQHHGLKRCSDKGLDGFKKYVGLSVLAYNIHKLGDILLKELREKYKKRTIKAA